MASVIRFTHVSKQYHIGAGRESLREAISRKARLMARRGLEDRTDNVLWAVRDVSFEVEPGEALGLVGPNGAGKSTTLKLLSRVTPPTQGEIKTQGRIASLIELGAGFHPDLTGRENIYLNGAIMGLSRQEVQRRFDDIVAFAELERFIDTPIKRYSSGMYARLGFAVAAHVDPDILLVDEVLAVGDMNFQRKCYSFIHDFVNSGRSTVFVSHNLFALEQLCDKAVWLNQGRVMTIGPAPQVLADYMSAQEQKLAEIGPLQGSEGAALLLTRVYTTDTCGLPRQEFEIGDDIVVQVEYYAALPVPHPHFVIAVWDASTNRAVFLASMLVDNQTPDLADGRGRIACRFQAPPLMPRTYQIWGEVYGADRKHLLVNWQPLAAFTISSEYDVVRQPGSLRHERADAPVRVAYSWLRDGPVNSMNGKDG